MSGDEGLCGLYLRLYSHQYERERTFFIIASFIYRVRSMFLNFYVMFTIIERKTIKIMSKSGKHFGWKTLYKCQKIKTIPFHNENFDADLEKQSDYQRGNMWLSNSFKVGGSDLSGAAINRE
jgi:hypothetical protein